MIQQINFTHETKKKITKRQTEQLFEFFQSQKNINLWASGKSYFFADGTEFQFKNTIIRRDSKNGFRYEVISKKDILARGSFSELYLIKGTVIFLSEDSLSFTKQPLGKERRVVKGQLHESMGSQHSLATEFALMKRAGHFAVKVPTYIPLAPGKLISYTVMNKVPGRELFDILNEVYSGEISLTSSQRLELTKGLLRALKEQVTDKNIIHRDIKAENIMVVMGPPIKVNIIDYGLGMLAGKPDGKTCGTLDTIAPEAIYHPQTVNYKTDVFSLARVISQLWNCCIQFLGEDPVKECINLLNKKDPALLIEGIFDGMDDIPFLEQHQIRAALIGMLAYDPQQRFSIDQAIRAFDAVGLQKSVEQKPTNNIISQYANLNSQCSFFPVSPSDFKPSSEEMKKALPNCPQL